MPEFDFMEWTMDFDYGSDPNDGYVEEPLSGFADNWGGQGIGSQVTQNAFAGIQSDEMFGQEFSGQPYSGFYQYDNFDPDAIMDELMSGVSTESWNNLYWDDWDAQYLENEALGWGDVGGGQNLWGSNANQNIAIKDIAAWGLFGVNYMDLTDPFEIAAAGKWVGEHGQGFMELYNNMPDFGGAGHASGDIGEGNTAANAAQVRGSNISNIYNDFQLWQESNAALTNTAISQKGYQAESNVNEINRIMNDSSKEFSRQQNALYSREDDLLTLNRRAGNTGFANNSRADRSYETAYTGLTNELGELGLRSSSVRESARNDISDAVAAYDSDVANLEQSFFDQQYSQMTGMTQAVNEQLSGWQADASSMVENWYSGLDLMMQTNVGSTVNIYDQQGSPYYSDAGGQFDLHDSYIWNPWNPGT